MNGKKKSIRVCLLFGGVLVCFCSCVSGGTAAKKDKPVVPHVWLTDISKYILLFPEDIEQPLDMSQLVSASYGDKDYYLNSWVLEGDFE